MIINQISMKNFQCYVGEHDVNCLKFSEGLNLVIGNNGGGKSKLFDAFYWVLYDQIFDSSTRRFSSTKLYGEQLISDKTRKSCDIGETATTEVMLTAIGANQKEYRLTRVFHATKLKDDGSEWACESSSLFIEDKKTTRWAPCSESDESVLKRVIPPHLKKYMWFQGEQVDSLMDLTDKSALTQIINVLSDISKYDEIVSLTEKGSTKASTELRKNQNKLSKNVGKSEELTNKYENKLKAVEKTESDISVLEENLEIANIKVDELISQIGDATKKAELKARKKTLEDKCEYLEKKYTQRYSSLNSKIFTDYWLLKNSRKHISKFAGKYSCYNGKHQALINENAATTIKLPINVPGPIHINKMLDDCRCYVCDREAPQGSDPWEYIKGLVERNNEPEKKLFKQDFSQYFQRLYESSLRLDIPIKQTKEKIAEEFSRLDSIRNEINESKSEIESITNNFENLMADDRSESIVSEFRQHEKNKGIFTSRLASANSNLSTLKQDLLSINKELENLVTGEVELAVINADKVFTSLVKVAKSTRKDVYLLLVKDLEKNANSIFKSMASRNNAITGKIQLKMLPNDTCIPEIVDNDGYIMSGNNDGNIILIKLSLIIAILTSKAKWSENYSLISDAPTAKMAKGYSEGFYEALSQNFKQSIVMTYDFIDLNERKLFKKNNAFKIGSIHTITSHFPKGNPEDRSDLQVLIKEVS